MGKTTFDFFKNEHTHPLSCSNVRGWALIVGHDKRAYPVMVQKADDEREPMVRVGCRYMTLRQARAHYVSRGRNYNAWTRSTAKEMLALIGIAVETAKERGLLNKRVKFNTTPRKVSR